MDPISQKKYFFLESQSLPPPPPPPSSFLGSSSSSHLSPHHSGFPIIAVAIIGILATGILLVSYYVFVIKCCLNWHRIDLLRRFSVSGRRSGEDPLMVHSPAAENRGLDEAAIRAIPIFPYRKGRTTKQGSGEKVWERNDSECAVCLNEFQEEEKLRIIPDCAHVFHIDCIDVWLQNNANCPLCRTSVSANRRPNLDQITARINSLSPRDPNRYRDNFNGRDEDYVVIEIRNQELIQNHAEQSLLRSQERRLNNNTGEEEEQSSREVISPSPRKLEQQKSVSKKKKKLNHVSSMGDECIDIRKKDEKFTSIQPIRRSFSMDSASDAHLYLAVQQIINQHQNQLNEVISPVEGSTSSSRVIKRSFFSFGHGRSSRSAAVLPLHVEPFS
ncbi:OLC1v1019746C1 [Oldenlandia corymbosa var. corymbosa]|uniref:RING-type E3 ubiquitin transferase n=1 Tax=Oldenlandia corymbosa var. corymbosa TaxID=529605 RepID=A0AAV1EEU6_OLDCO|nr:OLC1v1019746C1 [Oldenlandia corymbosa var. corymbosa]